MALPALPLQHHPSADLWDVEQQKADTLQYVPCGSSLTICVVEQMQELIPFSYLLDDLLNLFLN